MKKVNINGNYYKISGKRFWELISGEPELYTELIQPLSYEAEEKNNEFKISYGNLVNRLTKEFLEDFCDENGAINWRRLIIFNSSSHEKIKTIKNQNNLPIN